MGPTDRGDGMKSCLVMFCKVLAAHEWGRARPIGKVFSNVFVRFCVRFCKVLAAHDCVTRVMFLVMFGKVVVVMSPPLVKGGVLLRPYRTWLTGGQGQ